MQLFGIDSWLWLLPAGLLALWLWVQLLFRWLSLPYDPDETHTFQTTDGWQLPLYRWKPLPEAPKQHFPVLLCHGLAGNHHDLDFDETTSFARFLRKHGYDCWVMDLRAGSSPLIQPPAGTQRHDYSFDSLVEHDVPCAIQAVRTHTAATQLHWIGHSLGGMVIYAYGNGPDNPSETPLPLRSLTAIASPGHFTRKKFPLRRLPFFLRPFRSLSLATWMGYILAPFSPYLPIGISRFRSQAPGVTRRSCLHATAVISTRMLQHFLSFAHTESLCNEAGEPIYEARMTQCTVPAFFLTGGFDLVAPEDSVRYAYERWGGPKQWQRCSPDEGFAGFGHTDICWGKRVPAEIHPLVLRWLAQHDTDNPTRPPSDDS